MRGSHRRSKRHRRLVSTTFTLTGLVLSIFLMFGQLGLIVASADDRDRDGTFESDTDVISNDHDSASGGGSSAASSGGPQIQARDDAQVGQVARAPGGLSVDFVGIEPDDYNHTTGLGGSSTDTRTSLEAEDFRCGDLVAFFFEVDAGTDAASLDADLFFNEQGTNGSTFGFDHFVSANLDTSDPNYVDTGTAAGLAAAGNDDGVDPNGDDAVTVHLDITGIDDGDDLWVRVIVRLGHCGPGNTPTNVQTGLAAVSAVDANGDDVNIGSGGQQTVPLKLTGTLPTIKLVKDIVGTPPDQGKFDLRIDGNVVADDVGDNGTSGVLSFLAGTYPIDELAGTGTNLNNYTSSIMCVEATAGIRTGDPVTGTSTSLTVGLDQDWVCTFTNTAGAPNLSITKTANVPNDQVALNTPFTYTIDVTNTGNAQATGVVITDNLPDSLNTVSATYDVNPTSGQDGTCDVTVATNVVTCPGTGQTGITLAASNGTSTDTVRVTVTATSPRTCETLNNTASVQWTQNGTTPPVTSSQSTVTVVGCGIAISKTASPAGDVAAGGTVTFTIMAESQEVGSVTGVVIADTLPAGFVILGGADAPSFDVDPGANPAPAACGVVGQTVTCNVGTLTGADGTTGDGQDFVVVTIKATAPNTCGPYSNSATIDWDGNGTPVSSNTATGNVTGCAPSVSIAKTGASTVAAGANITWTITVSNTGNDAATNVKVTDTLPSGFIFVSSSPDATGSPSTPPFCTHSSGTVSCSLGAIPTSGSAQITITATAPNTCGPFSNSAAGTFGANDTAMTDSPATATGNVTGCAPSLQLSKTGASTVTQGQNITWTITVSNTQGNADATDVQLSDTLPSGFIFVSSSPDATGSPSTPPFCTHSSGTVSCSLGTIAAGGSASVTITATAPTTCGPFTNTVSGTFGAAAPQTIPGSPATATGDVVGCASSLTIGKSGPATVQQGTSITYNLTVSNSGNATAFNVKIADAVPSPLTGPVGTPSQGSCTTTTNTVNCDLGNISGGGSATISITATVPAGQCVQIQNQATGTHEVNEQPVTIQSSGTVTTQIEGCGSPAVPALSVTKTADAASVTPPSPIGFTIAVTNSGSAAANNVTLSDTIPSVPGVTWSINGGTGAAQCSLVGNSLSCTFGTLQAGQSKTVHVISTATSSASCGTFTNVAVANSSNGGSAQGQASVTVQCPSGIDIVKNGPATAYVGDKITYTFDVTLEQGSGPLANVQVSDPRCDPGTLTGPTGDTNGNGLLDTGETWHYSCRHVVTDSDPDPLPNTATVCSGTVCDSDDHVVEILKPAIEIVKKANPDSGGPGEVITYTYTVTNTGDVTLFDITVDDDILGHICDIPKLEPGHSRECTGTFTIPNNANVEITNVAIALGEDENGTEVSDEDTETVGVVRGTTVTPTKTPPGGIAFTGSGAVVSLVGLALLMLTFGTGLLWLGRRRGVYARETSGR